TASSIDASGPRSSASKMGFRSSSITFPRLFRCTRAAQGAKRHRQACDARRPELAACCHERRRVVRGWVGNEADVVDLGHPAGFRVIGDSRRYEPLTLLAQALGAVLGPHNIYRPKLPIAHSELAPASRIGIVVRAVVVERKVLKVDHYIDAVSMVIRHHLAR